jgi:putative membrane protein
VSEAAHHQHRGGVSDSQRAENPDRNAPAADAADASRRTWLAAERTWLAWWRTGLGAAAVAIAVGRFLPSISHGTRWPFRLLGIGYGLLAIAALVAGALRHRRTADKLRSGSYEPLSSPLVMWLTTAAVALTVGTIALIAIRF